MYRLGRMTTTQHLTLVYVTLFTTPVILKTEAQYTSEWYHSLALGIFFQYT